MVEPISISTESSRTYRIELPVQTENGTYHFQILRAIVDARGYQLDQNKNGIPGEPDDLYASDIVLDTVSPRATNHTPAGDTAGTVSSVNVRFSEKMDRTTF